MGFFSFTQEIAMDLGTANTIITSDGKIVVDEPSVVALDRRTDKMIAVGEKAKLMYEKTHDNIRTVRPLREGVIADFYACEQLMRGLIKMVHTGSRLFSPSLRMVIGVPSGSTEVELRAVRDSAEHAGGRDVYLIYEPMAAAIGIGIDFLYQLIYLLLCLDFLYRLVYLHFRQNYLQLLYQVHHLSHFQLNFLMQSQIYLLIHFPIQMN